MLNSGIDGKKAPFNFKRYPDEQIVWNSIFHYYYRTIDSEIEITDI
jgi:hypothetical protein